jgi:cytochrome c oxidase cbb3-type subunit I/II
VPYAADYANKANQDLMLQAKGIADDLQKDGIKVAPTKEIIALIAYMQRLGTDIGKK